MALTDRTVRLATAKNQSYKLADKDGLYLYVTVKGRKIWRYDYRFLGKRMTLTVGHYPSWSLADARNAVIQAKRLVDEGIDPCSDKKEKEAQAKVANANTFRAVALEYLSELEDSGAAKATVEKNRWVLIDIACPAIGKMVMHDIRPKHIRDLLKDIEKSGRLETAKRTRTTISSVFQLAAVTDRADSDPTSVLRRVTKAPTVTHHPAVTDERRLGQLLRAIRDYKGEPVVRLALEFQAYTFVRPIELRFFVLSEIDLEDSAWHIPAERMKMRRPHDVPLVPQTRNILRQVAKAIPRRTSLVFPSPRGMDRPVSENTLNKALCRLGFKREHTSHGFRSTASTILNERGYRKDAIELQLAHFDQNEVRAAYNRALYWDERVRMMADWADLLDDLREQI